jgi:polyphosphate glucokinase
MSEILGIDVGGSGIKGAPVNTETGELIQPRFRIPTPIPAKPKAVAKTIHQVAKQFEWSGKMGVGFPAIVREGKVFSAANVHKTWIGTDLEALVREETGCITVGVNDADAAGLAEMKFGAGKDRQKGVVMVLTLGTGVGSAIFTDGKLVPNTELGHLKIRGKDAEVRVSDATRQRKDLSWADWSVRLNEYLFILESLFSPDLFIIGGGVSKDHEKFFPYLNTQAEIVPAEMLNLAGIVGAALAAELRSD